MCCSPGGHTWPAHRRILRIFEDPDISPRSALLASPGLGLDYDDKAEQVKYDRRRPIRRH